MKNAAFILAGGFGSRLGKETEFTPKPMLDILGRPFLDYVIHDLISQGCVDIFISTHYLSSVVEKYITSTNFGDVSVKVIFEQQKLGTGGAVKNFLTLYPEISSLLVVNGDSIIFDRSFHLQSDTVNDWLLVLKDDNRTDGGAIISDSEDYVSEFQEKPKASSGLINAGVYHFGNSKELRQKMQNWHMPFSLESFMSYYVKKNPVKMNLTSGLLVDIGVPERLQLMRSLIGARSNIF